MTTILGDPRSAKSAISTHLEALNFDFCDFFEIFEGLTQTKIIQTSKPQKLQNRQILDLFSNFDFT